MPSLDDKIKDEDKTKVLKYVKIAGIGLGALLLLIGIPLIYIATKNKEK
tara:strand:- start:189 stop:335 length:147 start_codon:yes stop_codon:yes gene_type:complete